MNSHRCLLHIRCNLFVIVFVIYPYLCIWFLVHFTFNFLTLGIGQLDMYMVPRAFLIIVLALEAKTVRVPQPMHYPFQTGTFHMCYA
jgi:hypothetical protein